MTLPTLRYGSPVHLPVRLSVFAVVAAVGIATAGPAWASAPPTDGTAILDPPQPGTGVVTGRVTASDPDGDPLVYTAAPATPQGSVAVAPDGTFVYTPNAGGVLADGFTVTVSDGRGGVLDVPVGVPAAVPAAVPAGNGVTFSFDYGSGSQMWTPEARAALESAAATLTSSLVVDQPVQITATVTGINDPGAPNMASSWVGFTSDAPGYFGTLIQTKILYGIDANGPEPDTVITANFAERWAFGGQVPGDRYDFTTVAMHELTHALGFLSGMADPATDRNWTDYDRFLRAADGQAVIDDAGFAFKPQYIANLTGGNGGLFFGGPNAVAAFGGPVPLFTPDPWATSSRSVSHVNALPGYLMNPFYGYGPGVRALSPVEVAMLRDLGYRVR
jgi:hypothetical protein